jgi:hypothetical protein
MLVFLFLYNEQLPALQIMYGSSSLMVRKILGSRFHYSPLLHSLLVSLYQCPIIALIMGNGWAMIGQFNDSDKK